MFDLDLWRLRRRYRKAERAKEAQLKALDLTTEEAKSANLATRQSIDQEIGDECENIRGRIERHLTRRLREEATALDIEVFPTDDTEVWCAVKTEWGDNVPALTPKGRSHLRKLIDAEKVRRFEVKMLWVTKFLIPLLAALVGIIGALTGFVAVLHKR